MKKFSFIIGLLAVGGMALVGFWIYKEYFFKEQEATLQFTVKRGPIQDIVRVRGEVTAQKEYDLEFPFAGIIEKIFVKEGEKVLAQEPLLALDTTELGIERKKILSEKSQVRAQIKGARAVLLELQESLRVQEALLQEMKKGTRQEEIRIAQTAVTRAKKAHEDAQENLAKVIKTGEVKVANAQSTQREAAERLSNVTDKAAVDITNLYAQAKDVLADAKTREHTILFSLTDPLFINQQGADQRLSFFTTDAQAKNDAESLRRDTLRDLQIFTDEVAKISNGSNNYDSALEAGKQHIATTRTYLTRLSNALNTATGLASATLAAYQEAISSSLSLLDTAASAISTLQQKISAQKAANHTTIDDAKSVVTDSENNFKLIQETAERERVSAQTAVNDAENVLINAERELELKNAGTRSEQIAAQTARVKQQEAAILAQEAKIQQLEATLLSLDTSIESVDDKIKKSTLFAPQNGTVSQIWYEEKEVFRPGKSAVTLWTPGHEIEARVSELDIRKIRVGEQDAVSVTLDAYPGTTIAGTVMAIDPREVVQEGDKYYKMRVAVDPHTVTLRSGMSADLSMVITSKDSAIIIPSFAVIESEDKKLLWVLESGKPRRTEIKTGITDGQNTEVEQGLYEGQIILVLPE